METDWDGEGFGTGKGLRPFESKVAASDGSMYSVDDAERKDLAYLVENSCISCNRHLNKTEVKIIPPRYIQERDHYVRNGAVSRRLMCVACYNTLKDVTKTKIRIKHEESAITKKNFLMKTVINNLLLK